MLLQTPVSIPSAPFVVSPSDRFLFVGSCFAQNIGRRMADNQFRTMINPFGVMYNPASIVHTLQREGCLDVQVPDVVVLTLGTNHVYIRKTTNEIVDNCRKEPQSLFREEELSVAQCVHYLYHCVDLLVHCNPQVRIIFTVSPIRYAKYGFHESQLSKSTLLLAVHQLLNMTPSIAAANAVLHYFPSYEIMNDELRDYRFYAPDMLHPSEQAVDYIFERFSATYFSAEAHRFVSEWQPIGKALSHKPFHPESAEYQQFMSSVQEKLAAFRRKYHLD